MKPTDDLMLENHAIRTMLAVMESMAGNIRKGSSVDTDDVEKILDFLKTFADKCHYGKEEIALFPALVTAGQPGEMGAVGVMLNEHVDCRKYISALESSTNEYLAGDKKALLLIADGFDKYIQLLKIHIHKEENVLFKMADKILSFEVQNDISEKFEKFDQEIIGRSGHEQYHQLLEQMTNKYLLPNSV
jgi:hemerythrin-like domain-containing protein